MIYLERAKCWSTLAEHTGLILRRSSDDDEKLFTEYREEEKVYFQRTKTFFHIIMYGLDCLEEVEPSVVPEDVLSLVDQRTVDLICSQALKVEEAKPDNLRERIIKYEDLINQLGKEVLFKKDYPLARECANFLQMLNYSLQNVND